MMKHMRITIPFFMIFAMFGASLVANNVTISGYLTPAGPEVLDNVIDGSLEPPNVNGIRMTYSGQSNYSGCLDGTPNDGFFTFTKHHSPNQLRIIITTSVGYELLKNTVSHQEFLKGDVPIEVYELEKSQENQIAATTNKNDGINSPAAVDPTQWLWRVSFKGKKPPQNGLTEHDLVIHADPKHFYLQDGATYFAQESSQLIIPNEVITVISSPEQAKIEKTNNLSRLVESTSKSDIFKRSGTNDDGTEQVSVERTIINAQ